MRNISLIFFLSITTLSVALGQISTTKVQSNPSSKVITHYDSTRNYLGDTPQYYVGQTLYLKGQSETLRKYGYKDFYIDYTKNSLDKGNTYKCCQSYNSKYDDLAGRYFDVLEVIKHPKASENERLYGDSRFLKLKEKESGDIVYYEYKILPEMYWYTQEMVFPFLVVGFYEKTKKSLVGKEFILSNRVLKDAKDISTSKPVSNDGSAWKCTDLTIEETYFTPAIVAENSVGEKVTIFLIDINGREAKGKTYSLPEAEEYKKKFGSDIFQRVVQGKISVGMTNEMCELAWGKPKKINETITAGKVSEQWVYPNNNLYLENGIVTAIQTQE